MNLRFVRFNLRFVRKNLRLCKKNVFFTIDEKKLYL